MDRHVTSVAMLFIFFGAQGVFISLVGLAVITGGPLLSGDETAASVATTVGLALIMPFLVIESLKIICGVALLRRRPWARIAVLVLSFVSLFAVPIGTAYGIYAIWVLMKDESARLLAASTAER